MTFLFTFSTLIFDFPLRDALSSDERQATCDEFALFWSFYVVFCAFCASLRLKRTVFSWLQIKVRPKGLHSFALYILIFDLFFLSLTPRPQSPTTSAFCLPTPAPVPACFRQGSSYLCAYKALFTTVERSLQINLFMQNKAKFRKSQMNVTKVLTRDYEKRTLGQRGKKQSQTKPNKPKLKKANMNVTFYITKAYENKPPIRAPKKQSQIPKRQKPIQTSLAQGIMKKSALSASGKTNPNKPNFETQRQQEKFSKKMVNGIDRYLVLLYTKHYGKSIF
jgi:hypothetical protein